MSVEITTIDNRNLEVNGKAVYRDMEDKWVTSQELTPSESKSINLHILSL